MEVNSGRGAGAGTAPSSSAASGGGASSAGAPNNSGVGPALMNDGARGVTVGTGVHEDAVRMCNEDEVEVDYVIELDSSYGSMAQLLSLGTELVVRRAVRLAWPRSGGRNI